MCSVPLKNRPFRGGVPIRILAIFAVVFSMVEALKNLALILPSWVHVANLDIHPKSFV